VSGQTSGPSGTASAPALGIAELAERTGLSQQAIRAWETRFDFPTPTRTEGGRRVYAAADVDRIQRVVALKDSGVRLAQAIARVRGEDEGGRQRSIYAELRRAHPHLDSRRLRREVLIAISHAIEDEAMARASRPTVFGSFQREEFFRRESGRWSELARTSASCLVFADFPSPLDHGRDGPVEVPLEPDAPLLREWAVVVASPTFSVVMAAWEPPRGSGPTDPRHRELESVFTFDPAAVRSAAEVCLATARTSGTVDPELLRSIEAALAAAPTPSTGVDALVVRAFDYLQRQRPA
jgi:MerR family transcriptional regulator, light-induced transcriptional regulator